LPGCNATVNYSLAELLAIARDTAGRDNPQEVTEGKHYTISALIALAVRALNDSHGDIAASGAPEPACDVHMLPPCHERAIISPNHAPMLLGPLHAELRLLEKETGIAPDPTAPIVGYVRAVAMTGNATAQQLLARLKAALTPVL
jgi:hypothetical protein